MCFVEAGLTILVLLKQIFLPLSGVLLTGFYCTASVVPVRVSSDETSLLPSREARVSSLNWSESSPEKGGLSSARDRRSGVSGTNGSKTALWSTRVALSSTAPEDVVGFSSKNVKVFAVWEVLVVAGARWHFFCAALDQNFESLSCHLIHTRRYLFGVLKHKTRYAKESNGSHRECYNVRLGAS